MQNNDTQYKDKGKELRFIKKQSLNKCRISKMNIFQRWSQKKDERKFKKRNLNKSFEKRNKKHSVEKKLMKITQNFGGRNNYKKRQTKHIVVRDH